MKHHRRNPVVSALVLSALVWAPSIVAQQPDRSKPPDPGPVREFHLARIQQFTLSNGLPVVFLEKHDVPLAQVNVVVRAGGVDDPAGRSGLAGMVAAMLTEGAGSRDALALADAIDYLGATINAIAGQHTTGISLHTPVARIDSALALLADVALRPQFPPAELERNRKDRLTTLLQWRDEPQALASVIFNRTLYGTVHPYGQTSIGDESSVRAMTVADLRSFHASHFGSNRATLIVVGDVTPAAFLPKLESAFGSWKKVNPPSQPLPAIAQVSRREVILVDKPEAAQSEIRIGRIGVPRLTDDYYALVVMNTILGGSFTSRLNQNLREEHGYTVGARSAFLFRPLAGPFVAAAAVQTAVTGKALTEFMKELTGILQPASDAEVSKARNFVALGFPSDFQSVAQIASQLEELAIYNLPVNYFDTYIGHILAVTPKDVQRVAQKYLDPARSDVIIVGDRTQIEAGVKALQLGPLTVLSINDVMGPTH
jgi:zinc protease